MNQSGRKDDDGWRGGGKKRANISNWTEALFRFGEYKFRKFLEKLSGKVAFEKVLSETVRSFTRQVLRFLAMTTRSLEACAPSSEAFAKAQR